MNRINVVFRVPEGMTYDEAMSLIEQLVDIGLADAAATVEDSGNFEEYAVETAERALLIEMLPWKMKT